MSHSPITIPIYDAFDIHLLRKSSPLLWLRSLFPTGRATKNGLKTLGPVAQAACRAYGLEKCGTLRQKVLVERL
jgi:hypothetical protein